MKKCQVLRYNSFMKIMMFHPCHFSPCSEAEIVNEKKDG